MAKQECVKKGIAQQLRAAQGKIQIDVDETKSTVWYYAGNEYVVPTDQWTEIFNRYKKDTDKEHDEVTAVGGLHILGTERHEARRIDNQLRGRAGRQGDPGSSRFYLSLEDDLMRIFAKEWVSNLLQRLGMEEGVPIESRLITRRIESAQKAVEAQNFEARKHLLEYDDVMNKQREAVYGLRHQLLEGVDQKELILEDYVSGILSDLMDQFAPIKVHPEDWDLKALKDAIFTRFGIDVLAEGLKPETLNRQELGDAIFDKLKERYDAKEKLIGPDAMRYHERMIMLSVLDSQWKDHLLGMDHLKEGIGLRGYGQHDPLVEYKRESFDMFEAMMQRFQEETVRYLYLMQILERPSEGGAAGHVVSRLQWTKLRKLSNAKSAANWSKPAWLVLEICNPCSKSCAAPRKSGATILVRAARGRNIRSAVGRTLRKSKSKVSNHGGPRGTRRKPAGTFVNNRPRHFIFLTSQSQTISPQYCSAAGRLES
jgi:preprotein translocase subunit SecA